MRCTHHAVHTAPTVPRPHTAPTVPTRTPHPFLANTCAGLISVRNMSALAALATATTAIATANLMSPQQLKPKLAFADTEESLMNLTLPLLKQRCAALGTPVTGNKSKLVSMILDPSTHQKKKAKAPGSGIKKRKTKAPKLFKAGEKCKECGDEARPPGYTSRSISHRHAPSASAQGARKRAPRGTHEVGRVGVSVLTVSYLAAKRRLARASASMEDSARGARATSTAKAVTSASRTLRSTRVLACACRASTTKMILPSVTACARAA